MWHCRFILGRLQPTVGKRAAEVTESDVKSENFRKINEGLYEVTTDLFCASLSESRFTVKPSISAELLKGRRFWMQKSV